MLIKIIYKQYYREINQCTYHSEQYRSRNSLTINSSNFFRIITILRNFSNVKPRLIV